MFSIPVISGLFARFSLVTVRKLSLIALFLRYYITDSLPNLIPFYREYVHVYSVAVYQKYLTRLGELIIFEPWHEVVYKRSSDSSFIRFQLFLC